MACNAPSSYARPGPWTNWMMLARRISSIRLSALKKRYRNHRPFELWLWQIQVRHVRRCRFSTRNSIKSNRFFKNTLYNNNNHKGMNKILCTLCEWSDSFRMTRIRFSFETVLRRTPNNDQNSKYDYNNGFDFASVSSSHLEYIADRILLEKRDAGDVMRLWVCKCDAWFIIVCRDLSISFLFWPIFTRRKRDSFGFAVCHHLYTIHFLTPFWVAPRSSARTHKRLTENCSMDGTHKTLP